MKRAPEVSAASDQHFFEQARRQLIGLRKQLLYRRSALREEEEQLLESPESDWEDNAANRTTTDALAHLSDLELKQLRHIGAALERIEAGTYGRCLLCEEPIPVGRLRAMPEATTCASCAASNGN